MAAIAVQAGMAKGADARPNERGPGPLLYGEADRISLSRRSHEGLLSLKSWNHETSMA